MNKILLSTLSIILFSCCLNQDNQKKFNLNRDLLEFSSRINEGDTLHIYSNLSICRSLHLEHDIFTKENQQTYITTFISKNRYGMENYKEKLPKIKYHINNTDSLNYEHLLKNLTHKKATSKNSNTHFLRIIYKKDTIDFYSKGLGEQIPNSDYLLQIKGKLYPKIKVYQKEKAIKIIPPPVNQENILKLNK